VPRMKHWGLNSLRHSTSTQLFYENYVQYLISVRTLYSIEVQFLYTLPIMNVFLVLSGSK